MFLYAGDVLIPVFADVIDARVLALLTIGCSWDFLTFYNKQHFYNKQSWLLQTLFASLQLLHCKLLFLCMLAQFMFLAW